MCMCVCVCRCHANFTERQQHLLSLLQVKDAQVSLTWLRGETAGLLGLRGAASVAEA